MDAPAAEAEASSAVRASVAADAKAIIDAVDVDAATSAEQLALTNRQQAILDFERLWWKRPGAKEQAIRDHFDVSPTRYYQALNALLDLPEALSYDAPLVNRLQRLRDSAVRTRRLQ